MGKRRLSREIALQFLYSCEAAKNFSDPAINDFIDYMSQVHRINPDEAIDRSIIDFAEKLIIGILDHIDEIDAVIKKYAANWDFSRITMIDRNILRIASYEIMYLNDIPSVVSIDEAVDIAKKYSTPDSGKFVNGILDKVKEEFNDPPSQNL